MPPTDPDTRPLALFCSARVPASLVLPIYDVAVALREGGVAVVGGFQSPVERECLDILLRGQQPVTVCPTRGVEGMRLPAAWRAALAEGRLFLRSTFGPEVRRPTKALAERRNAYVVGLAGAVLVPHATPGGATEAAVRAALAAGLPVATLDHPANAQLVAMGARSFAAADPRLIDPATWSIVPRTDAVEGDHEL